MAATVDVLILVGLFSGSVLAIFPVEQGKWTFSLDQDNQFAAVAKHMYKDSRVTVSVSLKCRDHTDGVDISWLLRMSPCALEFISVTDEINAVGSDPREQDILEQYMKMPITQNMLYDQVKWINGNNSHTCSELEFKLEGAPHQKPNVYIVPEHSKNILGGESGESLAANSNSRAPRETASSGSQKTATKKPEDSAVTELDHPDVASVWVDGNYQFVLHLHPRGKDASFKAEVTIRTFYGDENYISAKDYPLLIFFGVMDLVYIVYGLVWLVLLVNNWRDLKRMQFWIGGVILLNVFQYAAMFALYDNVNNTGQQAWGVLLFFTLVSCLTSAVFLMLVMIVSVGYTVAKPRLARTYYTVLILGGLFFILGFTLQYLTFFVLEPNVTNTGQRQMITLLVVSLASLVLVVGIFIWIIVGLIRTTRFLRRTSKMEKLRLYKLFFIALVLTTLSTMAISIWSVIKRMSDDCASWKFQWIFAAFVNISHAILMLVIMLLWRPSVNNERYAFSPLLDAADEEDDEDAVTGDACGDGMKMTEVNDAGKPKDLDIKS